MNEFVLFFLIITISLILINKFNQNQNILFVKSNIDGRKYLVRKEQNSQDAADHLAIINSKILKLIDHVSTQDVENVHLLKENYNPDALSETIPGSRYTSYSVNKGEKIAICIRHKDKKFMDDNTILFVVIHELAHVMTISTGHTEEFWANMKFLLEQAEDINIYVPVDYSQNNTEYCGMMITSSPYDFKNKK